MKIINKKCGWCGTEYGYMKSDAGVEILRYYCKCQKQHNRQEFIWTVGGLIILFVVIYLWIGGNF